MLLVKSCLMGLLLESSRPQSDIFKNPSCLVQCTTVCFFFNLFLPVTPPEAQRFRVAFESAREENHKRREENGEPNVVVEGSATRAKLEDNEPDGKADSQEATAPSPDDNQEASSGAEVDQVAAAVQELSVSKEAGAE